MQSLLALRVFTLDDFVNQMEAGLEAIGANSIVRGQMVKNNPEITGLREVQTPAPPARAKHQGTGGRMGARVAVGRTPH